jgi:deoxyuridine 5'-triphosphate nucleotidohydrolase
MGDDIMQIKKVRRNAIIPQFQTEGAAAIDLCACLNESWLLTPETSVLIHTGISIHIADKSVVGLIVPRSGLGFNYGVGLMNTVGVIDSDYQGEIMVKLRMTHGDSYRIQPNERIAQMFFVPVSRPIFEEVEEFSTVTERGVGGFGSTGK